MNIMMNNIQSAIFKNIEPFSKQLIRTRYALDPGTLKQRLLKEVTKQILPPEFTKIKIKGDNISKREKKLGNYAEYLVNKCKSEVIDSALNKMILVFQLNHCKKYNLFRLESSLFDAGLKYFYYPTSIMKIAAKGSSLEYPIKALYANCVFHLSIIGDCDPKLCDAALSAAKVEPFLLLLGGVLDYRIMNIDQINEFAQLNSMEQVRETLLQNLSTSQNQIATNLYSHQNNLVAILNELANRNQ